ncbi:MAG: colanic acid/amylovoran biosynthesis glycosyltransferase [Sphingomonadales bacterium]|jgi:glycosyltransferase involved in cell wall biosynthesis|nr:colanic acid/amylovoran biosynthesis glycosyltransferase [Sphingomonadales bacterium]
MSAPADRDPRPVAALFRTPVFNPTERFIQDQAAALTRWRPLVVGLERKGAVLPALREGMILPAGLADHLLFAARGRGGGIEARLRAAGPKLIHAHFGTDGLKVLPLARALGVPLITHLRGYDVTLSKAALIASGRPTWIRYALGRGRLMRGGDLFLAVSEALREKAVALGYPAERTLTHYNGVDLDRFHPGEAPREAGLVLHVGRLVEKKGSAVLIDAMAGIEDARLVVIGDGPLRGALERRAGANVRFLGALPPDEVAQWMRRASVLAAPSLTAGDGDAEGLPNVVVEAAASGLPVVATHHSGIPEAVADGETGLLVPEGDVAALAARLGALLGSEPRCRAMGAAGRRLSEERFDRARLTERLEAIYDGVAARTA